MKRYELNAALAVSDPKLAEATSSLLRDMPYLRVSRLDSERGINKSFNIIFLDDTPDPDETIRELKKLKAEYPQALFFIVSLNSAHSPEHIVRIMKAGGSEYITFPTSKEKIEGLIREDFTVQPEKGVDDKALVFSFISSKGGLGSTTLAVNIAAAMARDKNSSTILLDMSLQSGDTSVLLDIIPETTIRDISKNIHRLDLSLLQSFLNRHEETGIELLAAPLLPKESEEVLPAHLSTIFDVIIDRYDYIVVDCATVPILNTSMEVFKVSTKVFIVIELSVPAVRNAARIFQLLQSLGINPGRIEFVVNRFSKGNPLQISEVEESIGKKIFWCFPNDYKIVMSSINNGKPLIKSAPNSALSKNIFDFLEKIKKPSEAADYNLPKPKKSFWRFSR